jgi:hypothetical protein
VPLTSATYARLIGQKKAVIGQTSKTLKCVQWSWQDGVPASAQFVKCYCGCGVGTVRETRKENLHRSPDLTSCDFFLWGFVKDSVYVPPLPTPYQELRDRIRHALQAITADTLQRV